jgi:hypothetical protein
MIRRKQGLYYMRCMLAIDSGMHLESCAHGVRAMCVRRPRTHTPFSLHTRQNTIFGPIVGDALHAFRAGAVSERECMGADRLFPLSRYGSGGLTARLAGCRWCPRFLQLQGA